MFSLKKDSLITQAHALPGRNTAIVIPERHYVNGNPLAGPFPEHLERVYFALGCFWGAERLFWQLPGVYSTAVGYAGGYTPNPTYQEVCSGQTAHAEAVMVVYDPKLIPFSRLLQIFWEAHDPTQGMRQGNDQGSQYRSAIYTTTPDQAKQAEASRQQYQQALQQAGKGSITTEIASAGPFFYAEEYHQQYLAKNPEGYCGLRGTGVPCRTAVTTQ